jgi:hypothetical protein
MDRNQMIGTFIGKTLGYAVQGIAFTKIAKVLNPQSVVLIKTGAKYGSKIIQYTAKNYIRTDLKTETIFSDAINASFFAD